MDGLLFWWEPHREVVASPEFSVAEEGLRNAFSAGTASLGLVTNDELYLSL